MRLFRLIYTVLLIVGCISVQAGNNNRTEKNLVYKDHYGIVNAIYADESRVVIDDINLQYNHTTVYYNAQGRKVRSIKAMFRTGVPVIYHYYKKYREKLLLKDVKIITMREYNKVIEGSNRRD